MGATQQLTGCGQLGRAEHTLLIYFFGLPKSGSALNMARSECGERLSDVSAAGKSATARLLTPNSRGFLCDGSRDVDHVFFRPTKLFTDPLWSAEK